MVHFNVLASSRPEHIEKPMNSQNGGVTRSQVKFVITDKHILRFAKNNRTVERKAFCLIVICVSCSSVFVVGPLRAILFFKSQQYCQKHARVAF